MSESEIQKLISIFLSLAIITSSIVFVFSDNLVNSYKSNYEESLNNSLKNNSQNSEEKNAFVESPKNLPSYYPNISLNDEFQMSGNLTDDFASYIAREIVKNNPNGPQQDQNGKQNIIIPKIESLTDDFIKKTLSEINLNLSDWDKEVEKNYSKINVINSSEESISNYLNDLNNIYEKYSTKIDFKSLLNKTSDYRIILEYTNQINNDFYQEFLNLKVPNNLLDLHKSLLKILTYQKELLRNGEKINNDPLYVYYLIESGSSKIKNALKDVEKEIERIKNLGYIDQNNLSKNNILEKIFFIKKTHAVIAVIDTAAIAKIAAVLAQMIQQNAYNMMVWLRKIATEILKDQLIHRMMYQIVRWIQGGGKPQFITDWKGFLREAISRGLGQALYEIIPEICQPFGPLVQIYFEGVNIQDTKVACTLEDIVNNIRNFLYRFKYGGWISYGTVMRPENNLWGEILITHDAVLKKGMEEAAAQERDASTSRGFLSTKICIKEDEEGECVEWQITTPGAIIGDIVGNAIPLGPIGRIVNAQDITALVSALVNSVLYKLILAAEEGLMSLFTEEEDDDDGKKRVTDPNDPCYGEIIGSESYKECRKITNSWDYDDSVDTSLERDLLIKRAKLILEKLEDAFSDYDEWLDIAPKTQIGLETIGGCESGVALCPNLSKKACKLNSQIEDLKTQIEPVVSKLEEYIENVKGFIAELESTDPKPSIQRLAEINTELLKYDETIRAPIVKLSRLKRLQSAVNENISESPQCQKSLPNL